MIYGTCSRCKDYKELLVHQFNGKNVVCLCQDCENEVLTLNLQITPNQFNQSKPSIPLIPTLSLCL